MSKVREFFESKGRGVMKIYKFRGLAIEDVSGKKINPPTMVYGNFFINPDGDYPLIRAFRDERGETRTYIVKPETVAQFLGYDRNNEEVYDNDFLNDDGFEIDIDSKISEFEDYISEYELAKE